MAIPTGKKPTMFDTTARALCIKADPDFVRDQSRELQYDFGPQGRRFYRDPRHSGAYGAGFSTGFSTGFNTVLAGRR